MFCICVFTFAFAYSFDAHRTHTHTQHDSYKDSKMMSVRKKNSESVMIAAMEWQREKERTEKNVCRTGIRKEIQRMLNGFSLIFTNARTLHKILFYTFIWWCVFFCSNSLFLAHSFSVYSPILWMHKFSCLYFSIHFLLAFAKFELICYARAIRWINRTEGKMKVKELS